MVWSVLDMVDIIYAMGTIQTLAAVAISPHAYKGPAGKGVPCDTCAIIDDALIESIMNPKWEIYTW